MAPKYPERAEKEETPVNFGPVKCLVFRGFRVAAVGFEPECWHIGCAWEVHGTKVAYRQITTRYDETGRAIVLRS